MANHANKRSTQLCDRREEEVTLNEVEKPISAYIESIKARSHQRPSFRPLASPVRRAFPSAIVRRTQTSPA